MRRIRIFDTTLRDGEQAAGGALTFEEKIEIGRQLQRLGVDVIEAGFPSTSPGDFKAVETMGKEFRDVEIAALSGFRESQLERTWEALKAAERPLLHTVISTSDIHIEKQLRISRRELVELTGTTVRIAKKLCPHVEFSAMDATRSDRDFVCQVFAEAIEAGATIVNIPDSLGYAMPGEFAELIRYCMDNVPGIDDVVVSVHCHDDLGEAVANSLAGIAEGVSQIECTINGVGERAGNAALEEIVMGLRTRADYFDAETGLVHAELFKTSRMVSSYMGMVVPPNKAVVGGNAFAHSSGLHQDGMLKERTTYEIMRPEDIGQGKSKIVLGKTSGRHAFRSHLENLGIDVKGEDFESIFLAFKQVADRKKEVSDRDIEAILEDQFHQAFDQAYELDMVQVTCGSNSIPTATVRLKSAEGNVFEDAALGHGPVHAVYQAINRMIDVPNELTEFSVQSVTEGIDAIGEVTIKIESRGRSFTGHGADTDIIVASAKAYVNALNRLLDILGTEAQEDARAAAEVPAGRSKMPIGKTLLEKVWDLHTVRELPSGQSQLFIGLHLVHEVTSPQAFKMLKERDLSVRYPERTFATVDHIIPTLDRRRPFADEMAEEMFVHMERNADDFGLEFFDESTGRQGIVHVIGPELGLTQPGMTIGCGDSHTSTHGAFGAVAIGVGTSQIRDVLASGCLAIARPKVRRIDVAGALSAGVFAKDVILHIIGALGVHGGVGYAYEYGGDVFDSFSMEERMTVCNMSIEGGARVGYVNPDQTTYDYIRGREFAPKNAEFERAVDWWESMRSDVDAEYDSVVEIDGSSIAPMVTWGINPGQVVSVAEKLPDPADLDGPERASVEEALAFMNLEAGAAIAETPIDVAFIGSCTNGRISDLREAAKVAANGKVANGIKALVVPGSQRVREQAEAEGLHETFREAGFEWREAGCSMCLAMNPDKLVGDQICASSSNRNFKGRQGSPTGRTLLMSPAMVAAAALTGAVADVRNLSRPSALGILEIR